MAIEHKSDGLDWQIVALSAPSAGATKALDELLSLVERVDEEGEICIALSLNQYGEVIYELREQDYHGDIKADMLITAMIWCSYSGTCLEVSFLPFGVFKGNFRPLKWLYIVDEPRAKSITSFEKFLEKIRHRAFDLMQSQYREVVEDELVLFMEPIQH